MESFWKWRWVMVGLGALLAVALIANGNVVIGAIIGVMAIVRIVMYSKMQRRRAELRARFGAQSGGTHPSS